MNELDKIFQSKLENHTAEYSDQTWDKIQSRLSQQKSKPRKLPWLWMSLLAVVVVGVVYLWTDIEDNSSDATEVVNRPLATQAYSESKESEYMGGNDNDASIGEGSLAGQDAIEASDNAATAKVGLNAASNRQTRTTDENISANENSSQSASSNKFNIQYSANDKLVNDANKNNAVINDAEVTNYSQLKAEAKGEDTNVIIDAAVEVTKQQLSAQVGKLNLSNDVVNTLGSSELSIRPLRTIGVSSYTTLQSENELTDIILSKSMMDDFRQDCPSFVTDRTGVYLDFYVSHEMPFSSFNAKAEELDPYAALRSNSEGPTYSFSAGARLTLMLPNGLGLKTGLNYSQVNEKFTHVNTDSDLTKEVITITTVGGMEVRDTNTIVIPGTRDIVSTNKYRSFDIPLLLSYEWDVRERTYMTVNGGIFLNLLFKESGKILSETGEVIDLADSSGDKLAIFKNNIGLSLFGSVGLHYRLTGNIDLILEPNVRVLVKSATVDSYSLDHKWITGGLITGMRYNF